MSFYEATQRHRVGHEGISAAQRSYTFNYLKYLPTSTEAHIVDLGCSEGISLEWLHKHGYRNIVGVDSDAVAIQVSREKLNTKLDPNRIVCADALSYLQKCDDDSIDMIVMFNVIEHIPKATILAIMSEVRRVLKKRGRFIAQTGNWENPFNIGLFTRDFTHEVMYTQNSLRQLMLMSGYHESDVILGSVRYKTTWRNFPLQITAAISGWLLKIYAISMRMYVRQTSPLIYCVVTK